MAGFFLSLSPQPCLFPLLPILKVKVKSVSRVRLFATWWTVASQAPPSMGFSRQEYWSEEYWSGLPFPSPGNLPDPGIEPGSPASQADALPSQPPGEPILGLPKLRLYSLCLGGEFRHHWYHLCEADNFYKLQNVSELLFSPEILLERLKSDFKAILY